MTNAPLGEPQLMTEMNSSVRLNPPATTPAQATPDVPPIAVHVHHGAGHPGMRVRLPPDVALRECKPAPAPRAPSSSQGHSHPGLCPACCALAGYAGSTMHAMHVFRRSREPYPGSRIVHPHQHDRHEKRIGSVHHASQFLTHSWNPLSDRSTADTVRQSSRNSLRVARAFTACRPVDVVFDNAAVDHGAVQDGMSLAVDGAQERDSMIPAGSGWRRAGLGRRSNRTSAGHLGHARLFTRQFDQQRVGVAAVTGGQAGTRSPMRGGG